MPTILRVGPVLSTGGPWELPSLVWGKRAGKGDPYRASSAYGAVTVQEVRLLAEQELKDLFERTPWPPPAFDANDVCARLERALTALRSEFEHAIMLETGFVRSDREELFETSVSYLREFPGFCAEDPAPRTVRQYACAGAQRSIDLLTSPWGLVAVILPHNAFLPLALACSLSARAAGNVVVLRAPSQSARSSALMAHALERADLGGQGISLVLAKGREFVEALCESRTPTLLHYFGGSQAISGLLSQSFDAGKSALFDGEGNVWAYVAQDHPEETVDCLISGAYRYNGQTCTSINGVIAHPKVYDAVRTLLLNRVSALVSADPDDPRCEVGPLFDSEQAKSCVQSVLQSGGNVLVGGKCDGSLLEPTLVEEPEPASALVQRGVFGTVLWIAKGDERTFARRWLENRFPLCAAVFERNCVREAWLQRLPNIARLCVNGDPTIEDPFEPWGGYAGSGNSPVDAWVAKYRRLVQIDAPVKMVAEERP